MAETREDIELETAILTRDRTKAEIAKLEAETRSLESPKLGFIERNWAALLTGGAGLVAGLGGLAALLSVFLQFSQLRYTETQELLDAHKNALDAINMAAAANRSFADAQKETAAAREDLKKVMAQQQQLAAEKRATLRELVSAYHVLGQYQTASAKETVAARGAEEKLAVLSKSAGGAAAGSDAVKILTALNAQPVAQTKGQAVDIQYADQGSSEKMDAMQSLLSRDGYDPADPELVNPNMFGSSPNEIRFFGGPDMQRAAQGLADKVNGYFASLCPGHPSVVANWHYPNADAPASLLELWIGSPCHGAEKPRHAEGTVSGQGT